jgi:hypothetical protein
MKYAVDSESIQAYKTRVTEKIAGEAFSSEVTIIGVEIEFVG